MQRYIGIAGVSAKHQLTPGSKYPDSEKEVRYFPAKGHPVSVRFLLLKNQTVIKASSAISVRCCASSRESNHHENLTKPTSSL